MLTIAIQKSGRLNQQSVQLLKDCGISFFNGDKSKLKSRSTNFPLQLIFLRDDDIPESVADAAADIGIVGENEFLERNKPLSVIRKLGYAKCRLSIAVPKQMTYKSIHDLSGKSIATSYHFILNKFLAEKKVQAEIHQINGSVEIAPGIGMSDAIFDIVSTGSTLLSNGLKEVETVLTSEAILIANSNLDAHKQEILDRLLFRIQAVQEAENTKYILLNVPNDKIDQVCHILPGMNSPTIMPLREPGWSSLHSVIGEDDFWERIEQLKKAGAEGILVFPIEKMIL